MTHYYPWYNQDADYQTNAKSYMDYLARTNKFMNVLVEDYEVFKELLLEEFKQFQLDTSKNIDQFNKRLDYIKEEMKEFFQEWADDGTIAHLINEVLFEQLNQKIDDLKDDLSTLDDKVDEVITQLPSKVIYPSGSDDTQQITDAWHTYPSVTLSPGEYTATLDLTGHDKRLTGHGAVIHAQASGYVINVTGDRNTIEGVTLINNTSREGLRVEGEHNRITHVTAKADTKYTTGSALSYVPLILIRGSHNVLSQSTALNGGSGITVQAGDYNTVTHCTSNHNTMGMRNAPSGRYTKITDNQFSHNNVTTVSGADGLLVHRNSTGIIISRNYVSDNGEHGIYFQGDHTLVSDNVVHDNYNDGIKAGAHQTQLYQHSGTYVSRHNVIKNNLSYHNAGCGIYYQTPFDHIAISGNKTHSNNDEGIKVVSMGESSSYKLGSLIVDHNQSESLFITGHEYTEIKDNHITGRLFTTATGTDASLRMLNPIISGNTCTVLSVSRARNSTVSNNTVTQQVTIQDQAHAVLRDNEFRLDTSLNCTNLREFINNRISFTNGGQLTNAGQIRRFINNYLESLSLGSEQFVYAPDWNTGGRVQVIGNHFVINTAGAFLELFGANALVSGNLFEGGSSSVTTIRMRGDNAVVSGNTSTNSARVNFHSNGIGKNNVLDFVNTPGSQHLISDNWT